MCGDVFDVFEVDVFGVFGPCAADVVVLDGSVVGSGVHGDAEGVGDGNTNIEYL